MDAAAFEQVDGAFQDFHAYFAPLFGHREARDHSRHYLQALLVQSGERRNAENLSETVRASARVMQRFLTESPWDDDVVIGRLQEVPGIPAGAPGGGVGAGRQRLPQAGQEVSGSGPAVLREPGQGVSLFRINVRFSVQRKCHSVMPRWYQMMTRWEPPGIVALEYPRHPGISWWCSGGFPLDCSKRYPLAPRFLNRLPPLPLEEGRLARGGGFGLVGAGHTVSDHSVAVLVRCP